MKNLSVIIPVYNKELFLSDCIKSVVNQSVENYEIIIIDDGSTDKSANIINYYKKLYNNIKVITNKKNMGVSYSRNKGIEYSDSKYIGFVDADDFVQRNFYEKLITSALSNDNPDIVRATFKLYEKDIFTNKSKLKATCNIDGCANNTFIDSKKTYLAQETISCCSKIYRSDFISDGFLNIPFEDEEFSLRNIINAKSILYLDDTSYHYFMDIGIHYQNNTKPSDKFLAVFEIYDRLFKLNSIYNDILLNRLVVSLYTKMSSIASWNVSDDSIFQIIQNIYSYMNYKYPNWKDSEFYYLILTDEKLVKQIKFVNKAYREDTISKTKKLIKKLV